MARPWTKFPPPAAVVAAKEKDKVIEEFLTYPISLSEMIREAVKDADSFKTECDDLWKVVEKIVQKLRSAVRMVTSISPGSLYDRPIRRILVEVSKNLETTVTLLKKCRRGSVFRRVMTIVSAADLRKIRCLLENSVGDVKWLLSLYDGGGRIAISLPPFACNDPTIAWIWVYVASLYSGQTNEKVEAANEIGNLAQDNDRNKKIIVEEGGVVPLLKLLKESSLADIQMAAGRALLILANDKERVCAIVNELGVPIVVQAFDNSRMRVQVILAKLVARMAEHWPVVAQEEFARENVIKPLVTLLSKDVVIEDLKFASGKQSIHSIVKINKEMEKNLTWRQGLGSALAVQHSAGSSRGAQYRKEREDEDLEVKLRLKISCADALRVLARGSVVNSRRITETKGLLCLARLVENERGELQVNCLKAIMEITAVAESDADLRRSAFKVNSPAAKAVVNQLLLVIRNDDSPPALQIPAIGAIGYLARTFSARETRVIDPLVEQLSHRNQDVAAEAANALGKFASPDNFLCVEHAETIIDKGVGPLAQLCRSNGRANRHVLVLLCYLVLHARNSEALEQPWVLNTIGGVDRALIAQHPELRELIARAIGHVNVYHSGMLTQRQPFSP